MRYFRARKIWYMKYCVCSTFWLYCDRCIMLHNTDTEDKRRTFDSLVVECIGVCIMNGQINLVEL